jgi:SAM-dependent methyltransferase
MTDHAAYFNYLRQRSRLGWLYRRYWLYPRLCRRLHGRVLDVGCGIGDLLRFRPDTAGVDINPKTVEWCRQQGLDARLMPADSLPFHDAEFEGVVLDNVLEHIVEPMPLLGEIRRVLRSGGVLLAGVPGRRGYALDADHKVFYDEADLHRTLKAAGFRPMEVMHMPMKSAWLDARMPQYCLYGVFQRD